MALTYKDSGLQGKHQHFLKKEFLLPLALLPGHKEIILLDTGLVCFTLKFQISGSGANTMDWPGIINTTTATFEM